MHSRKFRIRIAIINFVGYCTAILFAWYLDPRLPSHEGGPRSHPYTWCWLMVAPLVPLTTYFLLSRRLCDASNRWQFTALCWKFTASWLPLFLLGACASLFGFPPEQPHVGILISTSSFCAISFLTFLLRLLVGDFMFVNKAGVPYVARLEQLKATISTWQLIAVYGAASYLVFVTSWVGLLHAGVSDFVASKRDQFTLEGAEIVQIIIITFFVFLGPLQETFRNTFESMKRFSDIQEDIDP